MRRLLIAWVVFSCMSGGVALSAKQADATTRTKVMHKQDFTVSFYREANVKSPLIAKVPLQQLDGWSQHFVRIYQKGDWLKIGDIRNGDTGWINVQQYHDMIRRLYDAEEKTLQTVFIQVRKHKNKHGKEKIKFIAYKNGTRLSHKEAKHLYDEMRKDDLRRYRYMRHTFRHWDNAMDDLWEDPFFYSWNRPISRPWFSNRMEPVIVIHAFPEPERKNAHHSEKIGKKLLKHKDLHMKQ